MKRPTVWILAIYVGVAGLQAGEGGAPPPDDPRFEFLKGLAGRWTAEPAEPGRPPLVFEFRVTAAGHAVEEREMVGTPMEMVTVYHVDDGELVGTHYCALGNRPVVRAAEHLVDSELAFDCAGVPGGASSHDEEHVHAWTMRLADDGVLHYAAELVRDGRRTEAPTLTLTRADDAGVGR